MNSPKARGKQTYINIYLMLIFSLFFTKWDTGVKWSPPTVYIQVPTLQIIGGWFILIYVQIDIFWKQQSI